MTNENVYSALLQQEHILTDPSSSRDQQIVALKFIVHFVGDLHQPMHVSRAEDKGGNTIQLNYDGQGTNLHSLWDTKLLEHAGLNYEQLAEKYDRPTPEQVKKWQSDSPILWAWESYQVSTQLYAEVAAMQGHQIDNSYYEAHVGIVEDRIEKAGVRLAGILNQLFESVKVNGNASVKELPALKHPTAKVIEISDAANHLNESVTITGKVYGTKSFGSMVLVNLGAAYPNQLLTVVLREGAKDMAGAIGNKTITVTGTLIDYKGKPEIVVTDVNRLTVL